jgi:hypothetical protein
MAALAGPVMSGPGHHRYLKNQGKVDLLTVDLPCC